MKTLSLLDRWFALSSATAPLVMPLIGAFGPLRYGVLANGVVAFVAAFVLLARWPAIESEDSWSFGLLTLFVAFGIHLPAKTGANSGEAAPLVVVGVWVVAVAVSGVIVSSRRSTSEKSQ